MFNLSSLEHIGEVFCSLQMRQTSRQLGAGTQRSLRENRAGYETKVVGGVVQRTPITVSIVENM